MSYFKAKMHQIQNRLGLRPRPHRGSLQRSPDPLAGYKGPTSKVRGGKEGRGREGWEGKEREWWEGKERVEGKEGFRGLLRVPTGQGKLEKSGNLSRQGKSEKVRENAKMTGKSGKFWGKILLFLYSCCNANNSRAGVQSTIL